MKAAALLIALLAGTTAAALAPPDGAEQTAERVDAQGIWPVPAGPVADGRLPLVEATGMRTLRAWRLPGSPDAAATMAALRATAEAEGWQIVFACADAACGGFDFRFALDLLPEPDMHVNLADFRFIAARRDGPAGQEHMDVLVSHGGGVGYLHIATVTPAGAALAPATTDAPAGTGAQSPDTDAEPLDTLAEQLAARGRAVLDGVAFAAGSAELEPGAEATLGALADWLAANPGVRIALVGHTDFDGALAGNIVLSRNRAQAVRGSLIADYDVAADRLEAEGVGYLMPIATNGSADGRAQNRRVEAVVIALP